MELLDGISRVLIPLTYSRKKWYLIVDRANTPDASKDLSCVFDTY